MRAPFGRSRKLSGRATMGLLHALFALSLLAGLAVPLAPLSPAAAALTQGSPLPPPLPAPVRVALSGSFQTALGCPADFDPGCPQTQLQDNRDGSWSAVLPVPPGDYVDRKSTRLNSSHANISYAVFCLKKKTTPPQGSVS